MALAPAMEGRAAGDVGAATASAVTAATNVLCSPQKTMLLGLRGLAGVFGSETSDTKPNPTPTFPPPRTASADRASALELPIPSIAAAAAAVGVAAPRTTE